jgi:hypothetical protein
MKRYKLEVWRFGYPKNKSKVYFISKRKKVVSLGHWYYSKENCFAFQIIDTKWYISILAVGDDEEDYIRNKKQYLMNKRKRYLNEKI